MVNIKEKLVRLVGDCVMGYLDFFRFPYMKYDWGGPFNGQKFRQRIFFDLLYLSDIKAIVETGTFHGTTTALLAATTLPIYTVELQKRNYCYAKMRFLLNRRNMHLFHCDSRSFLIDLSKNDSVQKEDVFFYLDAHWGKDLPLRDELEIIFKKWKNPIVMVDDFEVPGTDYGFDDYGPDKSLSLSYIEPIVLSHELCVLFPSITSVEESGAKRGCVILCREDSYKRMASGITTLVRYKPDH